MTDLLANNPDHSLEPVYFAVENSLTADILLDYKNRRDQVFSPTPRVVGQLTPSEVQLNLIQSFGTEMRGFTNWLPWDIKLINTASGIRIEEVGTEYDNYPGLRDFTEELQPLIEDFHRITEVDADEFFDQQAPKPPTDEPTLTKLILASPLSTLEGTKPDAHTDYTGGPRGDWKLAHIAAIGASTLHYPGQATDKRIFDRRTSWIVDYDNPLLLESGEVSRLHPTSVHAIPLCFQGCRLVMRKFQKPRH